MIHWTNEQRRLGDLVPWPRNPRQIREPQAKRLVESFGEFGQVETLAIGPDNEIYNGHQRLNALRAEHGADYMVDVRVSSRPLTEREREKLTVLLHKGAAGEWDFDVLANEFDLGDLLDWGFEDWELGVKGIEEPETSPIGDLSDLFEVPLPEGVPDTLWPTDNEWGIPLLDISRQADAFDLPIETWGAKARGTKAGTLHFYTDDYRFSAVWGNPYDVVRALPVNIVEPNYSVYDQVPRAVALWATYKKRWLARLWQSLGVRIFVDLNVARPHDDINLLGVPRGWKAYATRGYTGQLEMMGEELELAKAHARTDSVLFLVYGGGAKVRDWCMANGAAWVAEDMDRAKGKYLDALGSARDEEE